MENNEMNVQNNETIEPVVKQKSNKGLIVLIIILILMVLGLCGYIVYDKYFMKEELKTTDTQTTTNYVGYYKGCNKIEGDEYCVELVLNEDNTAFLLAMPISPSGNVGNYEVKDNNIIINSNYQISSENAGIKNETYNLVIENGQITYTFNNTKFILSKTTEDKLDLYNQMKSSINSNSTNQNTTNNTTSNNNTITNQTTTETDEEIIKRLFIKEYLQSPEAAELLDYRIDKVEILTGKERQSVIEMGYQETDTLATVTYSVKVNDVNTSAWNAGNGEGYDGQWILRKNNCVVLRNGKLTVTGTSF